MLAKKFTTIQTKKMKLKDSEIKSRMKNMHRAAADGLLWQRVETPRRTTDITATREMFLLAVIL